MTRWSKFRASELILFAFFCYLAVIAPFFHRAPRLLEAALAIALFVTLLLLALNHLSKTRHARTITFVRDWVPIGLTYLAFREMEWFATPKYDLRLEFAWIKLDQFVLGTCHLRDAIEALGSLVPSYLELCYFLVYGVPAYGLWLLYVKGRRPIADRFLTLYLLGTLGAYALFPFFPSQPPRYVFPDILVPRVTTMLHALNVGVLNVGTIHTGVFPSAHVSSALSAAWALFLLFPERKRYGWIAFAYAMSVAVATIYSRYHYTVDVLAGIGVSLLPAAIALYQRECGRIADRELAYDV